MDIFPFTPVPFPGSWAYIGFIVGLIVGIPLFLGAFSLYLIENLHGRPPREEMDRMDR